MKNRVYNIIIELRYIFVYEIITKRDFEQLDSKGIARDALHNLEETRKSESYFSVSSRSSCGELGGYRARGVASIWWRETKCTIWLFWLTNTVLAGAGVLSNSKMNQPQRPCCSTTLGVFSFISPAQSQLRTACRQLCQNQCLDVCILPNELCLLINIALYTYKTLKCRPFIYRFPFFYLFIYFV